MIRKRDYIAEIIDTRSRAYQRTTRWRQFVKRNEAMIDATKFLEEAKGDRGARTELLKYLSIGTVACVEAYFRMAIRDLIEYGSPFDQNARKLQDIKLDLGIVLDMRRERVTHGELIAHLIPLNNLEDINRHMSILTDIDFLEGIKNAKIPEFGKSPTELIPELFENIKNLFIRRHIFCHEIAMKTKPRLTDERSALVAAILFVNACERLLESLLKSLPTGYGSDSRAL